MRQNPTDQYARLYAADVVTAINALNLPRYGLGNYVAATPHKAPTAARSQATAKPLPRRQAADGLLPHQPVQAAGKQRRGLSAVGRAAHPRNYIFLHAIENGLPLPLGTQDAGLLDTGNYDEDVDDEAASAELFDEENDEEQKARRLVRCIFARPSRFHEARGRGIRAYARPVQKPLQMAAARPVRQVACQGPRDDAASLLDDPDAVRGLEAGHGRQAGRAAQTADQDSIPTEKVLVFTQFADTVRYLEAQLRGPWRVPRSRA